MTQQTDRLNTALAGRYCIERELGTGGMATVYLAHDVKHDRDVAIKVLHPDLGAVLGAERFLSEIKTTAKLQHAHILPLLDSGDAGGLLYYVMPVVTGETLRARLERETQLPIADAVRIAREAASALDYAHRQGVIHRDLKPENILLHEGQALVADFGIALAVQTAGGQRMTQTGLSLGTPQYMSPEQAMGEKTIDARSDVYSLGTVAYEMLTGEPPFVGATVQATVAKVMGSDPEPASRVRKTIPPHVEDAVLTALAKLPADRFATAAEFGAALAGSATPGARGAVRAAPARGLAGNRPAFALGALALVALAAAAWGWMRPTAGPPQPVVKLIIVPPSGLQLPTGVGGTSIAISRDGSKIAFPAGDSSGPALTNRHIYVRFLDRVEPLLVPGSERGSIPFFSPDGASVGFLVDNRSLHVVPLAGGSGITIPVATFRGATWGDDGYIVYGSVRGLTRVAATGGTPELLLANPTTGGAVYVYPNSLPGARGILFGITGDSSGGALLSLPDRTVTRLGVSGINVQYADPGLLVFGQAGGTVGVVPFDLRRLRVTGPAQTLTDRVLVRADGTARFALSHSGVLAHFVSGYEANRELVLVDRQGRTTQLEAGRRLVYRPRFSPDGRRIAFGTVRSSGAGSDVWVYSTDARTVQRLTSDSASGEPEWDPDGKSLVYRQRTHQFRIPANGGSAPVPLLPESPRVIELRITADRRIVVYRETDPGTSNRIVMAPLDSPRAVTTLLSSKFREGSFDLSPDGRWLAYTSNETGTNEVYVRKLQAESGKWRVSSAGGSEPRFSRAGELFFRARDTVFVTRVEAGAGSGAEPRIGAPKALFSGQFEAFDEEPAWDVSPDGTRFAMVREVATGTAGRIGLYLNWVDRWRASRK